MLDRIWAQWQALNESNVYDIAGFVDTELEPLDGWRNASESMLILLPLA